MLTIYYIYLDYYLDIYDASISVTLNIPVMNTIFNYKVKIIKLIP